MVGDNRRFEQGNYNSLLQGHLFRQMRTTHVCMSSKNPKGHAAGVNPPSKSPPTTNLEGCGITAISVHNDSVLQQIAKTILAMCIAMSHVFQLTRLKSACDRMLGGELSMRLLGMMTKLTSHYA